LLGRRLLNGDRIAWDKVLMGGIRHVDIINCDGDIEITRLILETSGSWQLVKSSARRRLPGLRRNSNSRGEAAGVVREELWIRTGI
jgi:hypothetical protein